jgi:hypothetical protein
MNVIAAAPGWRSLAVWAMPPVAYALASDTLIGVVRSWAIARHKHLNMTLAADEVTPLAVLGGLVLWLLRLSLAPASTLAGLRAWVLEECPIALGRRADRPAPVVASPPAISPPRRRGRGHLRGYFHAAALAGYDMRAVAAWVFGADPHVPERILVAARAKQWALTLAELRSEAQKTTATVRMVMSRALAFMADPALAASVLPAPSGGFDIPAFLDGAGTVYMIAESVNQDAPVAPLFAAMAPRSTTPPPWPDRYHARGGWTRLC